MNNFCAVLVDLQCYGLALHPTLKRVVCGENYVVLVRSTTLFLAHVPVCLSV